MKKVIVRKQGDASVLEVVLSEPPMLNPTEVLVDVEAAGINYVDIYMRNGSVQYTTLPFVPGFEGVGRVLKLGAEVKTLEVGTRVAWINARGSYAQQIALPVKQAIVIPESFGTDEALLFQGVTAQYLINEYCEIKPKSVVLVHAAAGGVGQLLVQWLKHLGAIVIATASTSEKLETVRALGADHLVNYKAESFLSAVLRITDGRGVDVAFDAVGATTFADTVKALAPRGMAIAYGQASGVAPDVQVYPLILKGARVAGGSLFTYIADPAEMQERAAEWIHGVQEGWLKASKTTRFLIDNVADAHRVIEGRETQGKLALMM